MINKGEIKYTIGLNETGKLVREILQPSKNETVLFIDLEYLKPSSLYDVVSGGIDGDRKEDIKSISFYNDSALSDVVSFSYVLNKLRQYSSDKNAKTMAETYISIIESVYSAMEEHKRISMHYCCGLDNREYISDINVIGLYNGDSAYELFTPVGSSDTYDYLKVTIPVFSVLKEDIDYWKVM